MTQNNTWVYGELEDIQRRRIYGSVSIRFKNGIATQLDLTETRYIVADNQRAFDRDKGWMWIDSQLVEINRTWWSGVLVIKFEAGDFKRIEATYCKLPPKHEVSP